VLYLVTNRSALGTALERIYNLQYEHKKLHRERERERERETETKKKKGDTDEREIRKLQQWKQMSA